MRTSFFISVSSLFLLSGCASNEIGNSKDVNPSSIYFDYAVWGDEEGGEVTTKIQYRFGGSNGTTLVLDTPSRVLLDGKAISVDSSRMLGAYYETIQPVKEFAGRHTIVFADASGRTYEEEFEFRPFSLKTTIPATVSRGDINLELEGLADEDYIHLMVSDTSSAGRSIDRFETVRKGQILIKKSELDSLSNGPIRVEISREEERNVKNGTSQGGKIAISYGLRREFELK